MRWLLVTMAIGVVGCSPTGRPCGGQFLLLWPNVRGTYAPRVVEAPSLKSSSRLAGPAARVFYAAHVGSHGYDGPVAEPRVTNSGSVCVPTDAGSSAAVSAYLQFERLHAFDHELGVAEHLTWPRQVGVEIRLTGQTNDSINNAHYVGEKDLVLLVPTTVPGVPAAMNHGIVAHEHFHAHFQSQVLARLTPAPPIVSSEATSWLTPSGFVINTNRLVRTANDYVLRGWNEGLADFYAATYLGRPEFLRDTFPSEELVRARALDGPALYLGNDVVPSLVHRLETSVGPTRERAAADLTRNAYAQGSALARTLWQIVNHDDDQSPRARLATMMKSLHRLPARIDARAFSSALDYGVILQTLFEDVPLNPRACRHLRQVIRPGDPSYERITQCAGL